MRRGLVTLAIVALFPALTAATGTGSAMAPGLWELTQVNGGSGSTVQQCVTAAALAADPLAVVTARKDGRVSCVGTVMGPRAFFGILNTMYAAIDARRRDLATLRAIGFSRLALLISITLESIILALPGALVGAAIAWLLFDGHLGQVADLAFPITLTPGIVLTGIVWTLVFGMIGGLVPAVMAARLPIATALRSS